MPLRGAVNHRPPFRYVQVNFVHACLRSEVLGFDEPDDKRFFQFAGNVFVTVQEDILHQLHGNRATSAGKLANFQVMDQSFSHGIRQESPVIEESSVLALHDRHLQQRRDTVQGCEILP